MESFGYELRGDDFDGPRVRSEADMQEFLALGWGESCDLYAVISEDIQ